MYCLFAESSLVLIDRALTAGDIVKKQLSDAQSGTVVSTSLKCDLRPLCSALDYTNNEPRTAHGLCSSSCESKEMHDGCLPLCRKIGRPMEHPFLNRELYDIPASELKYWNTYREGDYVIYKGWVGRVRDVMDEVTVRLHNGSVVVVEDADELQETYWMDHTHSSELHKHLSFAGYSLNWPKSVLQNAKPNDCEAQPCYVGQIVKTKKGNLRRGRWKFGAYDPNITPQGIVVDVRPVAVEVAWWLPNIFGPTTARKYPPITFLDVGILESGEVLVYDHSRQPRQYNRNYLPGASHSLDIGFGHHVRFRDVAGATVKYDGSQETKAHFERIPRTATQGFDMNVLGVTRICSKISVLWQDGTKTKEDSIQLVPS